MADRSAPERARSLVSLTLKGGVYLCALLVAAGLFLSNTSLIAAGIWILIATPILRVVALAAAYALEGQWRFVSVCLSVLGLLAVSVMLGKTH